ncbi:MAG TPA: response regulator [Bacteriovoracaceae bacterium]|nr:response regulator [Bacteriovoracaceae bacterium]
MKHLLIIEDEILIQQSLKKLFERKGFKVDVSASGKIAIDMVINGSYDRIICDLMLQDISGFDVIEESKKKYSAAEISKKFVIMTAYNSPQVLSRANAYQCRLLNKPFDDLEHAMRMMTE